MSQDVPQQVDPQKIEQLRATLMSDGWQKIIKPALMVYVADHNRALIEGNARDINNKPVADDQLRALIKNANWMLSWESTLDNLTRDLVNAADRAGKEFSGGSPLAEQPPIDE